MTFYIATSSGSTARPVTWMLASRLPWWRRALRRLGR
jgi:hypothetical protein